MDNIREIHLRDQFAGATEENANLSRHIMDSAATRHIESGSVDVSNLLLSPIFSKWKILDSLRYPGSKQLAPKLCQHLSFDSATVWFGALPMPDRAMCRSCFMSAILTEIPKNDKSCDSCGKYTEEFHLFNVPIANINVTGTVCADCFKSVT
jgi:hypothetical protein